MVIIAKDVSFFLSWGSNIHFKTTFICLRSIVGVPSSQALSGYLITAHHLCAFLLYLQG